MKIDRRLNLVVSVERETGVRYVHSTPLTRQAFEAHALILGKTFALLFQQGLNFVSGPRIAAICLKQIAENMGIWDGLEGVENTLMAEIRRTSNVIAPVKEGGWGQVPLQHAIDSNALDEDELSEVENAIVFFIVISSVAPSLDRPVLLAGLCRLWDAQLESSNSTEFMRSLPTSTPAESSGETATA